MTYLGDADGSPFGLDRYMQIRACGTYRCRSQLPAAFSNESRVALHIVGMLLTVTTLVVGARSVLFLLKRVSIPSSNPDARSAIPDRTFASACGDSLFDHRSFAAV